MSWCGNGAFCILASPPSGCSSLAHCAVPLQYQTVPFATAVHTVKLVLLRLPLLTAVAAAEPLSTSRRHREAEPCAALLARAADRLDRLIVIELPCDVVAGAAGAAAAEAVPLLEVVGAEARPLIRAQVRDAQLGAFRHVRDRHERESGRRAVRRPLGARAVKGEVGAARVVEELEEACERRAADALAAAARDAIEVALVAHQQRDHLGAGDARRLRQRPQGRPRRGAQRGAPVRRRGHHSHQPFGVGVVAEHTRRAGVDGAGARPVGEDANGLRHLVDQLVVDLGVLQRRRERPALEFAVPGRRRRRAALAAKVKGAAAPAAPRPRGPAAVFRPPAVGEAHRADVRARL
eukprot:2083084-Prymnesium_polylepis.2